nr:MAG TPA: holin [Caudoviricetes sp.]
MDNNVVNIIVSILTGIATAIPLIVQLVKYVKQAVQEKNWNQLVAMVMKLMEEAEKKFETGADRKEWVMTMIKASSDSINYPVDMDAISALIDSLCDMSKVVNGKK